MVNSQYALVLSMVIILTCSWWSTVNMLLYCPWLLSLHVGDGQQSICSCTVHGYYPYMVMVNSQYALVLSMVIILTCSWWSTVNMLLYCPWLLSLHVGDDQQSICSCTVHGYYPYMSMVIILTCRWWSTVNMLLYCPWLLSLHVVDGQQSICSCTVHGYYPYM